LLLERDPQQAALLGRFLEGRGYRVVPAPDRAEALRLVPVLHPWALVLGPSEDADLNVSDIPRVVLDPQQDPERARGDLAERLNRLEGC